MKKFVLLFCLALLPTFAAAQKRLLNLDDNGVALQGHDPVAFVIQNKPVKGIAGIQSTYNGAKYYFATLENKKKFEAEPAKYEPQFGGYCAYGASKGKLFPIEVDAFLVVNGRLLMQYNTGARDKFNEDTQGNLKKADGNWPRLVEEKGR